MFWMSLLPFVLHGGYDLHVLMHVYWCLSRFSYTMMFVSFYSNATVEQALLTILEHMR